jgi:hypothetical protein
VIEGRTAELAELLADDGVEIRRQVVPGNAPAVAALLLAAGPTAPRG